MVFSQFVDHLTVVREKLDRKGVTYQYLDGSTQAGQRKKRVEDYQSGQGDVFLISLKAGGAGLKLTSADYVIHMDPLWNPMSASPSIIFHASARGMVFTLPESISATRVRTSADPAS